VVTTGVAHERQSNFGNYPIIVLWQFRVMTETAM
jgi:hypothetical protein